MFFPRNEEKIGRYEVLLVENNDIIKENKRKVSNDLLVVGMSNNVKCNDL